MPKFTAYTEISIQIRRRTDFEADDLPSANAFAQKALLEAVDTISRDFEFRESVHGPVSVRTEATIVRHQEPRRKQKPDQRQHSEAA